MFSTVDIIIRVAFGLVTFVGVVGNILVCLVVFLNKPMRTPMNYLLVNLAISDTMLLVFFSPSFIFKGLYTHPSGVFGDFLCSSFTGETVAWMGGYASSAILLAISIERYFAVAFPHTYGTSFVTRNLKIVICLCWVFALVWNSPGFFFKRYNAAQGFCIATLTPNGFQVYSMLSFFVLGVIPMTTMGVLYTRIIYILWFKTNVVVKLDEEKQRKKRKRATKMVIIVTIIYALAWFPELTVFVLLTYTPKALRFDIAYPATVALCSCNSAVNPIIYSLQHNQFKYYLKKLIRCGRVPPPDGSVVSNLSENQSKVSQINKGSEVITLSQRVESIEVLPSAVN